MASDRARKQLFFGVACAYIYHVLSEMWAFTYDLCNLPYSILKVILGEYNHFREKLTSLGYKFATQYFTK